MGELNLVLFLTASLALIIAPGPDNILVLTRGVTQGRGAALVSAAGASLGLVVHSIFAAVGLSALLAQSAVAFSVIKYVGAAYLIYLGIKVFLNREGFAVSSEATPVGLKSVFVQGVASNVLNPNEGGVVLLGLPAAVCRPHGGQRGCATVGARVDLRAADLDGFQRYRLLLRKPGELVGKQTRLRERVALADGRRPRRSRAAPRLLGSPVA